MARYKRALLALQMAGVIGTAEKSQFLNKGSRAPEAQLALVSPLALFCLAQWGPGLSCNHLGRFCSTPAPPPRTAART